MPTLEVCEEIASPETQASGAGTTGGLCDVCGVRRGVIRAKERVLCAPCWKREERGQ